MTENPYEAPDAETDPGYPTKGFGLLASSLLTGFVIVVHMGLRSLSYGYQRLFEGFGADLPTLTAALLPGSVIYFVLPAICIFSMTGRLWRWYAPRTVFIAAAVISLLMIPFFFFAMYQPIAALGSAV